MISQEDVDKWATQSVIRAFGNINTPAYRKKKARFVYAMLAIIKRTPRALENKKMPIY